MARDLEATVWLCLGPLEESGDTWRKGERDARHVRGVSRRCRGPPQRHHEGIWTIRLRRLAKSCD